MNPIEALLGEIGDAMAAYRRGRKALRQARRLYRKKPAAFLERVLPG